MDTAESLTATQQTAATMLFCRLCQAVYKQPKLLACLHSFCRPCLVNAVTHGANGSTIVCPVCSHETKLPRSGVVGVPDHSLLNRLCQEYLTEVQSNLVARSRYPTLPTGTSNVTSPSRRVSRDSPSQRSNIEHAPGTAQTNTAAAVEAIRNMSKLQTKIMSLQGEALRVTYAIDLVNQYASDWQQHKEDFKMAVQRRSAQFQFFIQRMEHQVKSQVDSKSMDDKFYAESTNGKAELRKNLNNILHEVNVLKGIQELGNDEEINALSSTVLGKSVGLCDVLFKKMHFELDTPTKTMEEIVGMYFGDIRIDSEETNVYAPKILDFNEVPAGSVPDPTVENNYFRFDERRQVEIDGTKELEITAKKRSVDRRSRRYNTDLGLNNQDVKDYLAQFQNARETFSARRREILAQGQRAREDASPLREELSRRPRSTSRKGRVQSLDRVALSAKKQENILTNRGHEAPPEIRTSRPSEQDVLSNSDEEEIPYTSPGNSLSVHRGSSTSHFISSLIPEDIGIPSPIPEDAHSPVSPQRKLVKQTSDPRYFRDTQQSPETPSSPDISPASHSHSLMEQLKNRRLSNPGFSTGRRHSDQYTSLSSGEHAPLGILTQDIATSRPVGRAISSAADRKIKIEFLRENWQKRKEILIQNEGFISSDASKQTLRPPDKIKPILNEDLHRKGTIDSESGDAGMRLSPSTDISDDPKHESMDQIRSRITQFRQELSKREDSEQKLVTTIPDAFKNSYSRLSSYHGHDNSKLVSPDTSSAHRSSKTTEHSGRVQETTASNEMAYAASVSDRKYETNLTEADIEFHKTFSSADNADSCGIKPASGRVYMTTDATGTVYRTSTRAAENYATTPAEGMYTGATNTEKMYGTTIKEMLDVTTSTEKLNKTSDDENNIRTTDATNANVYDSTAKAAENVHDRAGNMTAYGRTTAESIEVSGATNVSDVTVSDMSRSTAVEKRYGTVDAPARRIPGLLHETTITGLLPGTTITGLLPGTTINTAAPTISESESVATLSATKDSGAATASTSDKTIYRPTFNARVTKPIAAETVPKPSASETASQHVDADKIISQPKVDESIDETIPRSTPFKTVSQSTPAEYVPSAVQTSCESPTSNKPSATTTVPTRIHREPAQPPATQTEVPATRPLIAARGRSSRFSGPKTETLDIAKLIANMYSGNAKAILHTNKPSSDISNQQSMAESAATTGTTITPNTSENSRSAESSGVVESNRATESSRATESIRNAERITIAEDKKVNRLVERNVDAEINIETEESIREETNIYFKNKNAEKNVDAESINLGVIKDATNVQTKEINKEIGRLANIGNSKVANTEWSIQEAKRETVNAHTNNTTDATQIRIPEVSKTKDNILDYESIRDVGTSKDKENLECTQLPSPTTPTLKSPNIFTKNSFRRITETPKPSAHAKQEDNTAIVQDIKQTDVNDVDISSLATPQKVQPRLQRQHMRSRFSDGSSRRHTIEIGKRDVQSAMEMIAENETTSQYSLLQPISEAESHAALNMLEQDPYPSRDSAYSSTTEIESTYPVGKSTLTATNLQRDSEGMDLSIPAFKTRTPKLIPSPLQVIQAKTLADHPSSPQANTSPVKSPRTPPSPLSVPQSVIDQKLKLREIARKKKERWRHLTIS